MRWPASMHSEPFIRQYHAAIRRELAPLTPITVLHIGADQTIVMAGSEAPVTRILALGSDKTARDWLRHSPPTPLELEHAIAAVEEEVMPLHALVREGSLLYTPDEAMTKIAATNMTASANGAAAPLSVEDVEQLFSRLAAVSAGSPASQARLPLDASFYARVLILREFMHHLGFTSITPRDGR